MTSSLILRNVVFSTMSNEVTVHQYSKMILRSGRKSVRDLRGGKTLVSRAAKKLEAYVLRMINDKIYKLKDWRRKLFSQ